MFHHRNQTHLTTFNILYYKWSIICSTDWLSMIWVIIMVLIDNYNVFSSISHKIKNTWLISCRSSFCFQNSSDISILVPSLPHLGDTHSLRHNHEHDSSGQATFFHFFFIQFWCTNAFCRHFWRWTGISKGMQSCLQLCTLLWHLSSIVSRNVLVICAIIVCLWDQTEWYSFRSPYTSVKLGCLWSRHQFTGCPSFNYFC